MQDFPKKLAGGLFMPGGFREIRVGVFVTVGVCLAFPYILAALT